MKNLVVTKHAERRMQQRGVRVSDISLVMELGSDLGDHQFFLSNKDANKAIASLKKDISSIERLRNCKVVVDGSTLVTCYPCSKKHQKSLLREQHKIGELL